MAELTDNPDDTGSGRRVQARALALKALHAQAQGDDDEADRLFAEAQRIDPSEVAEVLQEHDAVLAPPDARDRPTADHDVERIVRTPEGDPAVRT